MSSKLEETEINLEEALQNISASKGQDKEKKELQKLVKQLQASLRDYETRQFANAKLISGLEKEKADLHKKMKESEHLEESSRAVKKIEKVNKNLRDAKDKCEQELAKSQVLLASKTNELANVKDRLDDSLAKIRQLEKEIRTPTMQLEPGDQDQLNQTVETLSKRYAQLKDAYQEAMTEIRSKSDPANCQKHQATIDALKQVAREAQLKLSKKTKDYERLLLTTAPAQPEILELKMPVIIIHL